MRHRLLATLAALAAITAPARAQSPATPATPAAEALAVRVQPFEQLAIRPLREAPASVVARNEARLSAEVAGRVLRWTADTGARVARGALLVELDPADYRLARDQARAALEASQARLKLAESQLQRARELVAQGFFSEEALNSRETEVQLIRTELASNRAQLAAAERSLAKTRITAPFAASVKERLAQTGEFVAAGTPLYVLTQTDAAEVSAQVALSDVSSVQSSPRLEFVNAGKVVPLKLLRTSATVTAPARTVEVRLAPSQPVVVGSAGQFRWAEDRPHVPASVVVLRERKLGIFVVDQGRAKFVPLPGAQEGRAAPAQLPADALVVVSGQAALRDGRPVTVAR